MILKSSLNNKNYYSYLPVRVDPWQVNETLVTASNHAKITIQSYFYKILLQTLKHFIKSKNQKTQKMNKKEKQQRNIIKKHRDEKTYTKEFGKIQIFKFRNRRTFEWNIMMCWSK